MNDLTDYYKYSTEPFKRENLENRPYFIKKKVMTDILIYLVV